MGGLGLGAAAGYHYLWTLSSFVSLGRHVRVYQIVADVIIRSSFIQLQCRAHPRFGTLICGRFHLRRPPRLYLRTLRFVDHDSHINLLIRIFVNQYSLLLFLYFFLVLFQSALVYVLVGGQSVGQDRVAVVIDGGFGWLIIVLLLEGQ